jgi:hypothetical protein
MSGHWTNMKGPIMRRMLASFLLAGNLAGLATLQASAQSPDPALLAPGSSRSMLRKSAAHNFGNWCVILTSEAKEFFA